MSFTLSNFHYYLSLLFYKYISKYESHILKGINLISFENINSKNIEAVFSRFDKREKGAARARSTKREGL